MDIGLVLLFIAFVAISYAVWRHNTRKLNKPRERWESFGQRAKERKKEDKDQTTK